jgi:hypothetical protein
MNADHSAITRPRRRWLQFRLRTLFIFMTMAAVALWWWNHRAYCLQKAHEHGIEGLVFHIRGSIVVTSGVLEPGPVPAKRQVVTEDQVRYRRLADHQEQVATAYRRAVYQPWLRWWIDEAPPREP